MSKVSEKIKNLSFYKKKPLYIILTIVFSVLLLADIVIGVFVPVRTSVSFDMTSMGDIDVSSMGDIDVSDFSGFDGTTDAAADGQESSVADSGAATDTTEESSSDTEDASDDTADATASTGTGASVVLTSSDTSTETTETESETETGSETDAAEESTFDTAEMGEMPSDGTVPDTSEMGEMPSDGTMPDMSTDGTSTDADTDSDSTDTDTVTAESFDVTETAAAVSFTPLRFIKTHWIPIAVVLAILDAASIVMLIVVSRKEKKRRLAEAKAAAEAAAAAGEVVHPIVRKKSSASHRHTSPFVWVVILVGMVLLVVVVESISNSSTATSTSTTEASILSGEAEISSISTVLPGTGTLTEEDSEELTLPDGVEISEWYVSDGDTVSEGDVLAAVDQVSVLSAVESIQTLLDTLDEELAEHEDDEISEELTATTAGRVKVIYAEEDTAVVDTMYESSALMLISLDGTMAVDLETEADLSAGDIVVVTLSDGTEVDGKVESYLDGTAVITVDDEEPSYGEEVTVTTEDGTEIGTGNLYIHSELRVTGYSGTVESVDVDVDDEIEAGDTLLTLTDTEYTGEYENLLAQREALEEQLLELFQLYQDGYLYASCSGVISGIDEDSVTASSSTGSGILSLLTNEPEETSEDYLTFLCQVTAVDAESGTLTISITAEPVTVEDYTDLSELDLTEEGLAEALTETATLTISDSVMVYTYTTTEAESESESVSEWVSGSMSDLAAGDILLVTCNRTNEEDIPIWIVYAGTTAADEENTEGAEGSADAEGAMTDQSGTEGTASDDTAGTDEASSDLSSLLSGLTDSTSTSGTTGTTDTSGLTDGTATDGTTTDGTETTTEEETGTSYAVSETTVASITPQDSMTITISVDELDILSLSVGQTAQVTLDALPGQSFEGTVTSINTSGSNSGGSSKYSVEVTIDRNESMLAGMNASVKITLSTTEDVLVIPEAALIEEDSVVYVYTSYDESTDTLGDPVEVTTGLSDGEYVEILSGLSEGDAYWYSYLDTVNYSVAIASAGSGTISFDFSSMGGM